MFCPESLVCVSHVHTAPTHVSLFLPLDRRLPHTYFIIRRTSLTEVLTHMYFSYRRAFPTEVLLIYECLLHTYPSTHVCRLTLTQTSPRLLPHTYLSSTHTFFTHLRLPWTYLSHMRTSTQTYIFNKLLRDMYFLHTRTSPTDIHFPHTPPTHVLLPQMYIFHTCTSPTQVRLPQTYTIQLNTATNSPVSDGSKTETVQRLVCF